MVVDICQSLSPSSSLSLLPLPISTCCCCSVTQVCLTTTIGFCSTPGFPVLHRLLEFAQTHVCWVSDAIQAPVLCRPLLLLPSIFPSIRVFSKESVLALGSQSIGASASASVLPMNIQDWFPLRLTDLISLQSKELSRALWVVTNTSIPAIYVPSLLFCDVCMWAHKSVWMFVNTFRHL